jgi:hypothetical protein
MESGRTAFEKQWPFEKLDTKYDEIFSELAPVLYAPGVYFPEPELRILQDACDYIENPKRHIALSSELKNVLDRYIKNPIDKKQIRRVLENVFIANHAHLYSKNYPFMLDTCWDNIDGCAQNKAIVIYHSMGGADENCEKYIKNLDNKAASFAPDFYDYSKHRMLHTGTELEKLIASYQYFVAQQQLKKLYPDSQIPTYLFGTASRGSVIAYLSSKFKKGQEPSGGFIMLAPNITEASPIITLSQPLLIIHSSKDRTEAYQKSQKWAKKHAKIGSEVYYCAMPNIEHSKLFNDKTCLQYMRAFLDKDFCKLKQLRLK